MMHNIHLYFHVGTTHDWIEYLDMHFIQTFIFPTQWTQFNMSSGKCCAAWAVGPLELPLKAAQHHHNIPFTRWPLLLKCLQWCKRHYHKLKFCTASHIATSPGLHVVSIVSSHHEGPLDGGQWVLLLHIYPWVPLHQWQPVQIHQDHLDYHCHC